MVGKSLLALESRAPPPAAAAILPDVRCATVEGG
jgi:hypothetical protein